MRKYMIIYSEVNENIKLLIQKAIFAENKDDVRNMMFYIAFNLGREAQLYEWDNENEMYKFNLKIEPEHPTRKEINP